MVQEHSPLQAVEFGNRRGYLCQERIPHNRLNLSMPAAASIAQQDADIDGESYSKPLKRPKCRNCLAVFNF